MNQDIEPITFVWGLYFTVTYQYGENKITQNFNIYLLALSLEAAIEKAKEKFPEAIMSSVHKCQNIHYL